MTRDQKIIALVKAHQRTWDRRFTRAEVAELHHIWRMHWWNELARAFPEFFKERQWDAGLTRWDHS